MPKKKNVWEVFVAVRSTRRGDIETLWYWRRTAYDGAVDVSPTGFATLHQCLSDAQLDGLTDEAVDLVKSSAWERIATGVEPDVEHARALIGSLPSRAANDELA